MLVGPRVRERRVIQQQHARHHEQIDEEPAQHRRQQRPAGRRHGGSGSRSLPRFAMLPTAPSVLAARHSHAEVQRQEAEQRHRPRLDAGPACGERPRYTQRSATRGARPAGARSDNSPSASSSRAPSGLIARRCSEVSTMMPAPKSAPSTPGTRTNPNAHASMLIGRADGDFGRARIVRRWLPDGADRARRRRP